MKMDDLEDRPTAAFRDFVRSSRSRLFDGYGLVYGRRRFGRREVHGGQYAATEFLHVFHLPIIPRRWVWVANLSSARAVGHDIRPTLASTFAGYAVVWGPIAALFGYAATDLELGKLAPIPFAIVGAVATVWAFATRRLTRARACLRSDLNLRAFGTRCDPLRMTDASARGLRDEVDATWAELSSGQTPEDVIQRGPASPAQAAAAYGVLRLAARLARKDQARHARAASEALIDRIAVADAAAMVEGGPFRSLGK